VKPKNKLADAWVKSEMNTKYKSGKHKEKEQLQDTFRLEDEQYKNLTINNQ